MSIRKTVLICEDDVPLNQQIARSIEERCLRDGVDVDIFSAYTLSQSLKLIDSRYFSLALIDLNLGGKLPKSWKDCEGINVIESLSKIKFGTKIFVSSANPETDLVFDLATTYSIDKYIAKGGSVDAYELMINSIFESLSAIQSPMPESHSEAFLGKHGSNAYMVEYSFALCTRQKTNCARSDAILIN